MKVLIDADSCPVTNIALKVCQKFIVPCIILCDTSHILENDDTKIIICDKGTDSVDFQLVNHTEEGDIVITQDYGLASMCLARKAIVINQDGKQYTNDNITGLLEQRYAAKKYRLAGGRTKGPKKRQDGQNKDFEKTLISILQNKFHGEISGGST